MICKIIRLFVNTFTGDEKYSLFHRNNLNEPIQLQLLRKEKRFTQFFSAVLKSRLNFEHFPEKDEPHS